MSLVTFSSDSLSAALDDAARFKAWRDRYAAAHGLLEIRPAEDRPFSLRFTFAPYGEVGVGQFDGTISHVARTAHHVATAPKDTLCLFLNRGRERVNFSHSGREGELDSAGLTLFRDWEPAAAFGGPLNRMLFVPIPRSRLHALVENPEDLAGMPLDARKPASRYLIRYLTLLSQLDEADDDEALGTHIGTTLLDLIALALGASRGAAHCAQMRGLRAARTKDVIASIATGFADPAFSPDRVAADLGVSVRYIQDLLHDTGISFSARLLENRLQRARAMLGDARNDRMRISQIARACGFNEVPYFNRCFRRRFGESPTGYRVDSASLDARQRLRG
jgi:AraC-like DNA-binding protein